jgi:glutamyl-tRNA reductase
VSAAEGLIVVGASHRSASLATRDRLFIPDGDLAAFDGELARAGIAHAIVLSTCDRVEVQAAHATPEEAGLAIHDLLARRCGKAPPATGEIYRLTGAPALRHVFAVAASLDSQVVGEPQVLGQVKAAHARARAAGRIAGALDAALQAAFAGAKRVRSETPIGERPVSLASAAAQLIRDVHGAPERCAALLIGTGEMGEMMLEHLKGSGLRRMTVAAPNPARAAEVAQRLGGHVASAAPLDAALAAADVVVTACGTGQHLVTAAMVSDALRARRRRPVLLIDLGVPADIDPAIDRLDDVFRYDLDDLERITISGRATREAAAAEAWAIIDQELAAFTRARAEREAVPTIAALRAHFEALRRQALAEANGDAARATELLMNRLLHAPSEALRRQAAAGDGADGEAVLRAFGLKDDKESK